MTLSYVLIVLAAVFVMGFFGAKGAVSFNDKRQLSHDTDLDLSMGFVLLISVLISACAFTHLLPPQLIFCTYAVLAMGLVCLVLSDMRLASKKYMLGLLTICFLSTYFMPSALFPAERIPAFFNHIGLSFVWVLLMWMFAKMDRVPFFSMILSTSMALCFFLLAGFFEVLPLAFGYLAIAVLISQMGINMYLKRRFVPRLGIPGSAFVGYIWGFFAIYLITLGYKTSTVILYAYPAMEIVFSSVISVAAYHRLSLQAPYLVERALAKNIMPAKVLQAVMTWGLLLAALAALSVVSKETTNLSVYYFALVIILVNAYMRLNGWGVPRPRLRDVGADLKKGLIEAKNELMTLPIKKTEEVASQMPVKETRVKKAPVTTAGSERMSQKTGTVKKAPVKKALVSKAPVRKMGQGKKAK